MEVEYLVDEPLLIAPSAFPSLAGTGILSVGELGGEHWIEGVGEYTLCNRRTESQHEDVAPSAPARRSGSGRAGSSS